MQTLITGLPGNGKTLYALQYVTDMAKREGRQVYYHNIKGLKPELGWKPLSTQDERLEGKDGPVTAVPQWWLCPAESIIVIDEAQNCGFGTRQRGLVPEWARKLETHRHLGVDIVFITQDPKFLDSHDRNLCELHFHVMRTFGMQRAVIHEFRPVRANVLVSRKGSIQHKWAYPKKVFDWYTSAEAHTVKRRIPMRVFVLLVIPFIVLTLASVAWFKYLDPDLKKVPVAAANGAASGAAAGSVARGRNGIPRESKAEYVAKFVPRVDGLAYTAPAFDDVTKPMVAPYPAACVMSAKRCQCYTQQASKLETTPELCKQIAEGGFFVSWQQPVAMASPMPARNVDAAPMPSAQPQGEPQGFGQAWGRVQARPGIGAGQEVSSVLAPDGGQTGPRPSGRGRALPKPVQPNNDQSGG